MGLRLTWLRSDPYQVM